LLVTNRLWAKFNTAFYTVYMLQMVKYNYFRFVFAMLKMRERGRQHSYLLICGE